MFRIKRVQLAFTEYARQIYNICEKSTVRLTSVGLAQARPNYYIQWIPVALEKYGIRIPSRKYHNYSTGYVRGAISHVVFS